MFLIGKKYPEQFLTLYFLTPEVIHKKNNRSYFQVYKKMNI